MCGWEMWGFLKSKGTVVGVPIIRTIIYWGPPILGKLPWIMNPDLRACKRVSYTRPVGPL